MELRDNKIAKARQTDLMRRDSHQHQLTVALQLYDLPITFGDHAFIKWNVNQIKRLIQLFAPDKVIHARQPKIDHCRDLIRVKSDGLSDFERMAVELIRQGRNIHEARYTLATGEIVSHTTGGNELLRQIDHAKDRECVVCYENLTASEFPSIQPDATCTHTTIRICLECYRSHIDSQLKSRSLDQIPCPEEGCLLPLTYQQMAKYAPAKLFARYDYCFNRLPAMLWMIILHAPIQSVHSAALWIHLLTHT